MKKNMMDLLCVELTNALETARLCDFSYKTDKANVINSITFAMSIIESEILKRLQDIENEQLANQNNETK